jgi:MFS family permease
MKKYTFLTIYLMVFLDIMGFGLIIPLLPFYAQTFGANEFVIGLLLASNGAAQLLFNPVWGRISDKFGRKPVVIITVSGSVIAYFIFGMTDSLLILFISRILAGIAGASISVAQSCISDITSKEERVKAMAVLGASYALGFVFGPALSGILCKISYSFPGYAASILSVINLLMVLIFLPESNKYKETKKENSFDWKKFNSVVYHPEMLILFSVQFLAMTSVSIMFSCFALFINKKFAYDASQTAYIFCYFGICAVIIQGWLVGKIVKITGEAKLLLAGTVCFTLGLGAAPFTFNLLTVLLAGTVIMFGNSFISPCITSLISKRAEAGQTGVTLGIAQSIDSLARVIAPVLGGYLFYTAGYNFPYLSASFLSFITFLLSIKILIQEKNRKILYQEI